MEILSSNTGYFLGYNGLRRDYLKNPVKGVIGDVEEQKKALNGFKNLIDELNPDSVLVQEIDAGSIRNTEEARPENLAKSLNQKYNVEYAVKYRGWPANTPILKNMSNAILFKQGEVINHYLDHGKKALVQELRIRDLSIFSVHLSTINPKVRQKQLEDLANITEERDKFIAAGDFNFHRGQREMEEAREITEWNLRSAGKTFPIANPTKRLDMVLCSENLEISCKKLDKTFSDHKPIKIKIH